MKNSIALPGASIPSDGWIANGTRRIVHRTLARLTRGRVVLDENGIRYEFGDASSDLVARIRVHSGDCYRKIVLGGTVGAGQAYMDGLWSVDDLPTLIRIFALNEGAHYGLERGLARLMRPLHAVYHFFRRNTRRGSRRNIAEHYDLGNEFYRLFLDETMAYSCGIFERDDASMLEASEAKFERICRKLRLSSGDHLLEIGTGWGGLAIYAARRYGCRVTTTTISREQYELATERIEEAGLSDRIRVLRSDYRDLEGEFDKLVSVEMIEAVGDQYYDLFFEKCSQLLAPDGLMVLQAITIADQDFERHRKEVDFIKRYIFPGSCIPSVTALLKSSTRSGDLRLFHLEDITRHYVTTLRKWRDAFWENVKSVRAQGFSDRFIRMWDFYLGYCEGGFAERYLGDVQMVLAKPGWRD